MPTGEVVSSGPATRYRFNSPQQIIDLSTIGEVLDAVLRGTKTGTNDAKHHWENGRALFNKLSKVVLDRLPELIDIHKSEEREEVPPAVLTTTDQIVRECADIKAWGPAATHNKLARVLVGEQEVTPLQANDPIYQALGKKFHRDAKVFHYNEGSSVNYIGFTETPAHNFIVGWIFAKTNGKNSPGSHLSSMEWFIPQEDKRGILFKVNTSLNETVKAFLASSAS